MTDVEADDFSGLNNQLLNGDEEKSVKRNTKDDLIAKIVKCCTDNDIPLEHSNTRLKRMGKTQLQKLLAECIEKAMRNAMSSQVGAPPGSSDSVVALGALRMIHDLFAASAEKGLNVFLPRYGYEVNGFASSLKEPTVRKAVDQCLEEIARETDVLQYIESPWARLGIAWSGALLTCVHRKEEERIFAPRIKKENGTPPLGPKQTSFQNTLGSRARGWPASR
jgi:hypothetical protein